MTDTATITRKIKALINHAKDQAGTPEGDAFYAKACALMADYGVELAHLDDDADKPTRIHIDLAGAYTPMQASLITTIAKAMHCTAVASPHPFKRNTYASVDVFGRHRHLTRVEMLATVLTPAMLAEAKKQSGSWTVSTVTARRSFMAGFAHTIGVRLKRMEHSRADGHATATASGEVALLDDEAFATAERDKAYPELGQAKAATRTVSAEGYYAGASAGDRADIGQTRVAGLAALTA